MHHVITLVAVHVVGHDRLYSPADKNSPACVAMATVFNYVALAMSWSFLCVPVLLYAVRLVRPHP